jgi:site-specific recombinase XerD
MHNKVWWVLARQWIKSGKKTTGNVWLNIKGKPYTDTRKTGVGGSPIRKAHMNALARLKSKYNITIKMRIHDWRHDFASRMVMAGVDLLTVQKLGGWKSLDMLKRYATFSAQHEIDSINKI